MAITVFENSYITVENAETYFNGRLFSDAWNNAQPTDKEKALIMASKRLDQLRFIGYKKISTQTMEFPRVFSQEYERRNADTFYSVVFPEFPQEIADSVCEEALALLDYGNSAHLKNQKLNISSINIGIGTASYNTPAQNTLISKEAFKLASKWTQKGYSIR